MADPRVSSLNRMSGTEGGKVRLTSQGRLDGLYDPLRLGGGPELLQGTKIGEENLFDMRLSERMAQSLFEHIIQTDVQR